MKKTVYFYYDPLGALSIPHGIICLAEGFTELGYDCVGNINLYKEQPESPFLIKKVDLELMDKAEIIFFHSSYYLQNKKTRIALEKICMQKNKKYKTVFIDEADGVTTPGFAKEVEKCDLVLKSHFNTKYKYPKNFIAWQFGLSNRIIKATIHTDHKKTEKKNILVNFRVKHQLRDYINTVSLPIIQKHFEIDRTVDDFTPPTTNAYDILQWEQTGARHYPQYYEKLKSNFGIACYGGVFAIPLGCNNKYMARIMRELNKYLKIYKFDRVRQWDSWRLWEAWAAACLVFHIDLEKYGCKLPVMPTNGIHYIGINPYDLDTFEKLLSLPLEELEQIAIQGREFAFTHYSPRAIAERLILNL